ncbi:DNA polymerase III subunit gamma/tau [Duganella sp. FT109W]|uniref:DNA-directed DNA polymerase n=1 Tax=Duganella margarita TaxID=2692170 RepID=A0ABW9WPL3_9BURK|nr:DNA polymerase III subunit gamma/tau [Duganella margarita]MYN41975.1 DNA polymerase III subunit gamma/tau [Duganella margarita]
MSYQVLARKYRPRNFETLVGQEHVVRALTHALHSGRLHHAYLFTGTRGVGKTTLSRILAKSLNCIGPDGNGGITATPCGVCEACTAIDAGRFVDYIEMDAASNRGVDEMAQLLEQAVYAPSNARFKVYMIDEVHMLTNHAFNAMLKTLEEPPEHVKFILATTDPQKIPVTVLSRCLQFNLKQMPPGHIIGHLENILGQEGITFEHPALRLLAAGAHGSMRDALSLTDQAIAYAAGEVTLDAVQGMLGALDQSYLIRLLDALAAQDGADLLAVADEMAARSLSYNGALQDLGTLLHRIALAQTVPAALPEDLPEYADIVRLAAAFDAEEVQLYYQIAVHGRNELGLAPDEYAGFSMTLLRMLAFRPGIGGAEGQAPAAPAVSRQAAMASARAAAGAGAAPARAAANVQANHASVVPPSVIAGAAAMARNEAPPAAPAPAASMQRPAPPAVAPTSHAAASAPAPHAGAPTQTAPAPAPTAYAAAPTPAPQAAAPAPMPHAAAPAPTSGAPISTARAAITAALEAARAASRPGGRPSAPAPASAPQAAPSGAAAAFAPPTPASSPAVAPQAPSAAYTPPAAPLRPAPWEDMPPAADGGAAVLEAPVRVAPPVAAPQQVAPAPQARQQAVEDDVPSWVTEFSDDSAVAAPASSHPYAPAPSAPPAGQPDDPHAIAMPARAAPAPAKAPYAYVVTPVPELNWDGNWPAVAAALPLRGTAQQLAMQAEMVSCTFEGNAAVFTLRVPIETWRTSGNLEKLTAALTERFGRTVRVDSELGAVWYTGSAEAQAYRDACQRAAEDIVANDPFVNSMIRELDAWVVPGTVVPPQFSAAAAG